MLRSTKSRDAPLQPLSLLWSYEADGPRLVSGRFFCLGEAEGAEAGATKAANVIPADLKDGLNQSQVADLVKQRAKVGRRTTLTVLDSLVRRRQLSTTQGPRGAILYHRASDSSPPAA